MKIFEIFVKGADFTNTDEEALEMMEDFKDHKVGIKLDSEEFTIVVKDSRVSLEQGVLEESHVIIGMTTFDMCEALDNSYDLMEIKDKGNLLKGDMKDPTIPVHFMAIFPLLDAMVRLYEDDADFKKTVDDFKASL